MPKTEKSPARPKSYARLGAHDWRRSGYDTFSYDLPFFRRWIGAQLGTRKTAILSVGCGSGELEDHLARLHHEVVGLDLSHQMLQRAARNGLDRVVQADARFLPFGAGHFGLLMIMELIGYLDLDEVFAEARRVLKKRGRLLVTTYGASVDVHAGYRKWRMEELTDRLVAAGFRIDEQRYLIVNKHSLRDAPLAARSTLLYISSRVRG